MNMTLSVGEGKCNNTWMILIEVVVIEYLEKMVFMTTIQPPLLNWQEVITT